MDNYARVVKNSKRATLEMIEDLRVALKKMFHENKWMDASTRRGALAKADAITPLIGYMDMELNETAVDEHYEKV